MPKIMKQLFPFGWMDLWTMKPMNNDVYVFREKDKLNKGEIEDACENDSYGNKAPPKRRRQSGSTISALG